MPLPLIPFHPVIGRHESILQCTGREALSADFDRIRRVFYSTKKDPRNSHKQGIPRAFDHNYNGK